jgi:hypothetical protein
LGAGKTEAIKLLFDRRLRLEFRGAKITTDAGLLAVRELDEVMGLTDMAADLIADKRTGKNIQHQVPACFASRSMPGSPATRTPMTTRLWPETRQ